MYSTFGEVLPLYKVVLLKVRSHKTRTQLSAVKLVIFCKLDGKCPKYKYG